MKPNNEITLQFTSRSVNEGFARTAVACFASQLEPTLEELSDIKTAVSEAVTNCVVHAYRDELGLIYIRARIFENNSVEITVRDRGCGIEDLEQAMQPLYTTGGSDRSGMGFTIMSTFMDSVRVRSSAKTGTTVTMRKMISPRLSGRGQA